MEGLRDVDRIINAIVLYSSLLLFSNVFIFNTLRDIRKELRKIREGKDEQIR